MWWLEPEYRELGDDAELVDSVMDVVAYRQTFQSPLKKVTVGTRQFVRRDSNSVIVAQRLKRLPQIISKLARFPGMRLSQMEDVGGCRAILEGGASEVAAVLRRIRRNWEIAAVNDYVAVPKPTGYRAVHVVVLRDERPIEIQLRTPGQHDWAEAVERTAGRTGFALKDGQGPADLLRYFELASHGIASSEAGERVQEDFEREFANLRDEVRHYLRGNG
jgi:GTP pyrophosphokinase